MGKFLYMAPEEVWPPIERTTKLDEGETRHPWHKAFGDQFEAEVAFVAQTQEGMEALRYALFQVDGQVADMALEALFPCVDLV